MTKNNQTQASFLLRNCILSIVRHKFSKKKGEQFDDMNNIKRRHTFC